MEITIDKEWVREAVQPVIDNVKANYIPKSVIDDITDEIYREKEAIRFDMSEQKARWTNSGIYDGLEWALEIIKKHTEGSEG